MVIFANPELQEVEVVLRMTTTLIKHLQKPQVKEYGEFVQVEWIKAADLDGNISKARKNILIRAKEL